MSSRRPKSPGWAAFDLKQKQKHVIEPQSQKEPYPLLPRTLASSEPYKAIPKCNSSSLKSFSSVLFPSLNYPDKLVDNNCSSKPPASGNGNDQFTNKVAEDCKPSAVFNRLKTKYGWADDGLIEDILATVGNDFEIASISLEAMVSAPRKEESQDANLANVDSGFEDLSPIDKSSQAKKHGPVGKTNCPSELSSLAVESFGSNSNFSVKDHEPYAEIRFMLGRLTHAPVEPEWEEDDVYLSQRKDSIKLIRAAARHARAASKSFLAGDRYSARHLSMKAHEERAMADKLNAQAASEILRIHNEKNGMWKLDLHGLHAVEAVEVLQERLRMIETKLSCGGMAFPDDVKTKQSVQALSSGACTNFLASNERAVHGQRPRQLEIITGRGNHSRGEAAIPVAMKSFLAENGYRFEEARPGVIMVRPKYRHQLTVNRFVS